MWKRDRGEKRESETGASADLCNTVVDEMYPVHEDLMTHVPYAAPTQPLHCRDPIVRVDQEFNARKIGEVNLRPKHCLENTDVSKRSHSSEFRSVEVAERSGNAA
ncbi:hypothetical protein Q5P01_002284 [Channa striata]|uniref:Uncharacterized protein n=1 Tax=Channa striata TaxID=64152 RepID=A0AA88NSH2_CHASR|nr:hypothetical protein Q5P01_002284 [Channa striata]